MRPSRSWPATSPSTSPSPTRCGWSRWGRSRRAAGVTGPSSTSVTSCRARRCDVPLRLSFPFGAMGDSLDGRARVWPIATASSGRERSARLGVRGRPRQRRASRRDRDVDRLIAGIYAARARRAAVALNRDGDFDRAREALRSTARKIRGYAGDDQVLLGIVDELMRESEQFHRVMDRAPAQGPLRAEQPRHALPRHGGQGAEGSGERPDRLTSAGRAAPAGGSPRDA